MKKTTLLLTMAMVSMMSVTTFAKDDYGPHMNIPKETAADEAVVEETNTIDLSQAIGWQSVGGKEYYYYPEGILWRNKITPDNFYVNADGEKVTDSEIDPEEMAVKSQNCRYIVFDKSSHHLELWQFGNKTHTFIVSAGYGIGDKEVEGDYKTPEGEFYVCKKVPNSSYHLGIGVSYPSIEDAERGLATGLISRGQYNKIVNANNAGITPNWYTPLGGEIEFHGNRQPTDATRGCIGMRNEDIEVLYHQVRVGDRIWIKQ
jgi:L,D-peptidoglycan transpeptidase YkuD (ErfK/YbiS/YcfS/YnhG family)